MTRILVRSGKGPFDIVSPEATLAQDVFNSNTGNYLFAHSVYRALSAAGADLVPNATLSETRAATERSAALVSEEFDAFVIPLANAFRPEFERRLDNLASLVERLSIPVVVVGVGAQADLDLDPGALEAIAPTVTRFTQAVLDRSASLGVRGEFTADYLRGLGFPADAVDVIGCPSLFLEGPDFRIPETTGQLADDARIALSLTEGVHGLGELVERLVRRHPHLVYVGQDKEDLRLMLWGEAPDRPTDPGVPLHLRHDLFRLDRVRFPVETWSWLDYLSGFDYAAGTRLHGSIAALLAGTPATLIAHDSRTWELARHHQLPHVRVQDDLPDLELGTLHAGYDATPFNAAYPELFGRFTGFLERNGLSHAYAPGESPAAFDQARAAVELPPVVVPLTRQHPEAFAARLRWLRDGMVFDSTLHRQAFQTPFAHPLPADQRTAAKRDQRHQAALLTSLEKRVRTLRDREADVRKRGKAHERRLGRQTQRLDRQAARLEHQAARIEQLETALSRRFGTRLRAWLGRLGGSSS